MQGNCKNVWTLGSQNKVICRIDTTVSVAHTARNRLALCRYVSSAGDHSQCKLKIFVLLAHICEIQLFENTVRLKLWLNCLVYCSHNFLCVWQNTCIHSARNCELLTCRAGFARGVGGIQPPGQKSDPTSKIWTNVLGGCKLTPQETTQRLCSLLMLLVLSTDNNYVAILIDRFVLLLSDAYCATFMQCNATFSSYLLVQPSLGDVKCLVSPKSVNNMEFVCITKLPTVVYDALSESFFLLRYPFVT